MRLSGWTFIIAMYVLLPVSAFADFTVRDGLEFNETGNVMVKEVVLPEGDAIFVYLRDMRPEINVYIVCPDPDDMLEVRRMISGSDGDLYDFVLGRGCFAATDGHGIITHVHRNRVMRVKFWHLVGHDFDTSSDIDIEHPETEYWAISVQLGTMFTSPVNQRVEPLVDLAWQR